MPVKVKDYVNQLQLQSEEYLVKWDIAGFKDIPFMSDHYISSSTFAFGDRSEASWQMMLSKEMRSKTKEKDETWRKRSCKEESDENKERAIGFRLTKVDDSSLWEAITFRVQVTAGHLVAKTAEIVESGNSYFENERFDFIYESDMDGAIFEEEKISIEAKIVYKFIEPCPLLMTDFKKQSCFAEGFTSLHSSQKHADVVLKAGDAEILAHKSVLCARAYGFDVHLQEDPDYTRQKLELDLDESVAKAMLCFIYCGGLPSEFPLEKYPALCTAAEKYKVKGLKNLISKCFKEATPNDVCRTCLGLNDTEDIMKAFLRLSEERIRAASQKCSHKQ